MMRTYDINVSKTLRDGHAGERVNRQDSARCMLYDAFFAVRVSMYDVHEIGLVPTVLGYGQKKKSSPLTAATKTTPKGNISDMGIGFKHANASPGTASQVKFLSNPP